MKVEIILNNECDPGHMNYIKQVPAGTSLLEGHKKGKQVVVNFFNSIPDEKLEYRYEAGKWTIKELLQHIIDTERVFVYRCFRIARRDATPLMGFDQNEYNEPSNANNKTLDQLLNEYTSTKNHTIALIESLSEDDLGFMGTSSGGNLSARAAAFIIIGHEIWHMNVIKKRYL